jgi:uridine kinase
MAARDNAELTLHRRTLRFLVAVAAERELPGKSLSGGHAVGEGFLYSLKATDISSKDMLPAGEPEEAATPPAKMRKLARSSSKLRDPLRDTTNVQGFPTSEEKAKGYTDEQDFESQDMTVLRAKLNALVQADEPIKKVTKTVAEALQYFKQHHLPIAQEVYATRSLDEQVDLYECDSVLRPVLFALHSSAGKLAQGAWSLLPHPSGFIAAYARDGYISQPTLVKMQADHRAFREAHKVNSLHALNNLKTRRERLDFVLHCEFRQEAKIAEIVRQVKERQATSPVKVICIAGPTSSGKTTFSNKLNMYLRNAGLIGQPLSVDDYYLPLEDQPKYQARRQLSDIDFDAPESLDWKLVHEHIHALTRGESIMMPIYNMRTSDRDPGGHPLSGLPSNGVLVIEGIHALSPEFTEGMDKRHLFRIFISPITSLHIDDANALKTTDHRLLRKLCRDFKFRGRSGSRTLDSYAKARRGEHIWIFPNQNDVDFVMNSACEYETAVLAGTALPLLREVPEDDPNYAKARELVDRFSHIDNWEADLVPSTSLLREFIGDGAFDCH